MAKVWWLSSKREINSGAHKKLTNQLCKLKNTISTQWLRNSLVFLPVRIGVIHIKSATAVRTNLSRDIRFCVQTAQWLAQFIKERKTSQYGTVSHYPTPMWSLSMRLLLLRSAWTFWLRLQLHCSRIGFPFDHSFPFNCETFLTAI